MYSFYSYYRVWIRDCGHGSPKIAVFTYYIIRLSPSLFDCILCLFYGWFGFKFVMKWNWLILWLLRTNLFSHVPLVMPFRGGFYLFAVDSDASPWHNVAEELHLSKKLHWIWHRFWCFLSNWSAIWRWDSCLSRENTSTNWSKIRTGYAALSHHFCLFNLISNDWMKSNINDKYNIGLINDIPIFFW